MTTFVFNNFVYDVESDFRYPLQSFSFKSFRKNDFHGVCFHFAQWAKSVVLVWSEYKNIDIQCYIFDVILTSKDRHSYNYFICNGDTYVVDFTAANNAYINSQSYQHLIMNIGDADMYDYSKNVYKDKVYNVY